MPPKPAVGVVMGGWSSEREVSLSTGKAIAAALSTLRYPVVPFDLTRGRVPELARPPFEVAFLALHGTTGEDGSVQGFLETAGVAYTGSGVLASALAMDKPFSKAIFRRRGLPTPPATIVRRDDPAGRSKALAWARRGGWPVVVKPAAEGSSVGVRKVEGREALDAAVSEALSYGDRALVERYVAGKEVTVGILDDAPLPPVEIRPREGLYSYASKYTPGMTEYVAPAPLPEATVRLLHRLAHGAHRALGCRDYSRVDFRVTADGAPFILEVNTIPGMTPTSLLPKAALVAGISFEQLVKRILGPALRRRKEGAR